MKSKIVKLESKKNLYFPKLMKGCNSGVIVLFHEDRKGQVVNGQAGNTGLGYYHEEFNMEFFEDFNGTIKLSNK